MLSVFGTNAFHINAEQKNKDTDFSRGWGCFNFNLFDIYPPFLVSNLSLIITYIYIVVGFVG